MQNEVITHMPSSRNTEVCLEKVANILDAGAQSVMISVGHKTGLFETLSTLPPSSSGDIAHTSGLAERYVREWLASMTMAGIVEYDPAKKEYWLPVEYAACLTREGELGNLAVYAQMVSILGAVEERALECFRTGKGTTYSDYPCFHQFMSEDSGQTVVAQLFSDVLPLIGGITDQLQEGIEVLDAGCARGLALIALAEHFPASRFTGYDLCQDAIGYAKNECSTKGLDNVRFEVLDMTGFEAPEQYDLVTTFDAVHDQKNPRELVGKLYRSLKPGGIYLMQDIGGSAHLENNHDFPMASFLYAASCLHCTPISIGQGGQGLGTMWGWETAQSMLQDAGFDSVSRHVFEHDPMNVWFISRKGGNNAQ